MFGGLEVKGKGGGSSKEDTDKSEAQASAPSPAAAPAPAPAPASSGSAFSFLSSSSTASELPGPTSSAFSFLGGSSSSVTAAAPETSPTGAPAASETTTSAFSFLASPSTSKDAAEAPPPPPAAAAPALSAFSFMHQQQEQQQQQEPSSQPAKSTAMDDNDDNVEEELAAAEPRPSSFSFLAAPSPTASSPLESPPDIMNSSPPAESRPPVGSGVVFGGAAAAKKKNIKKRTRGVKVGQARAEPGPPPAPRPISPVAATLDRQASSTPKAPDEPQETTKDAALEAMRRAEQFMQQKQQNDQEAPSNEAYRAPSSPYRKPTASEAQQGEGDQVDHDDTYEAALAAAEEAQAQMARQKRPFGLPWLRKSTPGTNSKDSSIGSGLGSWHDGKSPETAAERIQREQEDIKRAMAERTLAMQHNKKEAPQEEEEPQQSLETPEEIPSENRSTSPPTLPASSAWGRASNSWTRPKSGGEPTVPAKPPTPPPPPQTPKQKMEGILETFEKNVKAAMERVSQLRQQRNMLLEERFVSLAKERLAVQQIAQAEAQQMAAAEAEDFDFADRLAAVIDGHEREKAELASILDNIGRALAQLDSQKQDIIGGVGACFETVRDQLEMFQEEQESTDRKDDTEAMRRFSTTARQLSAENERLQNDFKIMERDEELVAEERKELEQAIHEQTEDMERQRDEAGAKLDAIEEEIEELRRQLAEKEAKASALRAEVEHFVSGISKVRVKFSRQLTRVEKKEVSVRENRHEWENEKAAYESLKAAHEAEVTEHSEALLAHDELMDALKREITLAATLQAIVAKEVVFENTGDTDEETDSDLAHLQADVVKCEAAVSEGKQLLKAAQAALSSLEDEHKALIQRIPFLEEEKKAAVARRDFKAAGKASKEIKDARVRLQDCEEELTGEATARKESALTELGVLEKELEAKRKVAHEKEKEVAQVAMEKLAEKIKRLLKTKNDVCGESSPGSIQGVGALVLRAQLDALRKEGQAYGAKFGGWETLTEGIDYEDKPEEEATGLDAEETDNYDSVGSEMAESTSKDDDSSKPLVQDVQERHPEEVDPERILKFKEVTDRLKEAEESLEAAVSREDYDEAAQLDEVFQQIKNELENLKLTDAELELAMCEDDADTAGQEASVPVEEGNEANLEEATDLLKESDASKEEEKDSFDSREENNLVGKEQDTGFAGEETETPIGVDASSVDDEEALGENTNDGDELVVGSAEAPTKESTVINGEHDETDEPLATSPAKEEVVTDIPEEIDEAQNAGLHEM